MSGGVNDLEVNVQGVFVREVIVHREYLSAGSICPQGPGVNIPGISVHGG